MNVIRAKEAGWSIAVEHDREPEMDNVRYWIFTCDTCGATFHHQERGRGWPLGEGEREEGSTFVRSQTLNNIN